MTYYYLATPYSKFTDGIEAAFRAAAEQAALFVRAGVPVYSPIAHTHPVAIYGGLDPLDHKVWLPADAPFMQAAKALVVCQLDGWDVSYGISEEVKAFRAAGKPVIYMTPGEVPDECRPKPRRIIGLTGYATAGKDEAAKGLPDWTRVALADGVREAVCALNPIMDDANTFRDVLAVCGTWDNAKRDSEVRRLLQRMGTEAGRNIHGDDCWIKIAHRKVEAAPGNVVITDVRFANEAAAIRSWGGRIVRVERPGVGPVNGHSSEAQDFEADDTLINDGTIEELHIAIQRLIAGEDDFDQQLRTSIKQVCSPDVVSGDISPATCRESVGGAT